MDVIPKEKTSPPDGHTRKENAMVTCISDCAWLIVQVDIGSGLQINSRAWKHIQGHQKDSLFVKDLLLGIWPKKQLKNRSLQEKRCPRFPDRPAKTPLTPWKVEVMRDCYRWRLQCQGIPENLVPAAVEQLNHFVVEKLAGLERLGKWEKTQEIPE
nr:BEN domain-containing protein 5-like [Rhipicephalus microplus]